MNLRHEILRKVEKKRSEQASFEAKAKEAAIYIQALEDTLKMLPPDDEVDDPNPPAALRELREGTLVARAKEILLKAGHPLHIGELLSGLGRPNDKDNRAALSGSLGTYFRKGEIFTKTAPNTFGLVEFGNSPKPKAVEPPSGFGSPEPEDEFPQGITDDDVPF
jgi:hypothetical protein